ncbi:MAG: hypothetical protein MHPSP_002174 [Paramarteilia canceri]
MLTLVLLLASNSILYTVKSEKTIFDQESNNFTRFSLIFEQKVRTIPYLYPNDPYSEFRKGSQLIEINTYDQNPKINDRIRKQITLDFLNLDFLKFKIFNNIAEIVMRATDHFKHKLLLQNDPIKPMKHDFFESEYSLDDKYIFMTLNDLQMQAVAECAEKENLKCQSRLQYELLHKNNLVNTTLEEYGSKFNDLARQGDSLALFMSSIIQLLTDESNESEAKANIYMNLAAAQGSAYAKLAQSFQKYNGFNENNNFCEAIKLKYDALEHESKEDFLFNNASSHFNFLHEDHEISHKGKPIFNLNNVSENFINFYHFAMNKTNHQANILLTLAITYLQGFGDQEIDYVKALDYFMKAAEKGSAIAKGAIAKFFISDLLGIEKDYKLAEKFALESASSVFIFSFYAIYFKI